MKKTIQLNKSQVITLISETILEMSHIKEAIEDEYNPIEQNEDKPKETNHYLDETPDEGWEEFWDDWQNNDVSQAEFKEKYGKTTPDFKEDFIDEVYKARREASEYYKDYYSDKHPDVIQKFYEKARPTYRFRKEKGVIHDIKKKLYKYLDKPPRLGINYVPQGRSTDDSWGYVPGINKYTYYLNLYNFTNPTKETWREKIYSTTIHEIGHVIENILQAAGIRALEHIESQRAYKRGASYIGKDEETYARIQQLRRVFNVASNISAKQWAKLWMDKVNNGSITYDLPEDDVWENLSDGEKYLYGEKMSDMVNFVLTSKKNKVVMEISQALLKKVFGFETPSTYDDVKNILKHIMYDGHKKSDIANLLAHTAFNPDKYEDWTRPG